MSDPQALAVPVGVVLLLYVAGLYVLGAVAQRRVVDADDFLVAGRRLGVGWATATLLATWFGAGTLLTASDEIRAGGVVRAALDPIGAGLCLVVAGLWFAKPLRDMNLLTLGDFFAQRFGRRAELMSALLMVPSYFGWIAAQLVALATVLQAYFSVPPAVGILLVAIVGVGYTVVGGMWSVTLTDALQMTLVVVGLLLLVPAVLASLGEGSVVAGLDVVRGKTPAPLLQLVPTGGQAQLAWVGVLAVGALGNLPGQDLFQRVFSAKSSTVARRACLMAGALYLALGALVVVMALASRLALPGEHKALVIALAHGFLSPPVAVVFTVALTSAVLSTIDSAILSPSAVLSENVLVRVWPEMSSLRRVRWCVLGVTAASVVAAYVGESAYALLESAYALPLAGLLVPLALGLWRHPRREASALASMGVGTSLWAVHLAFGWETFLAPLWPHAALPVALTSAVMGAVAYVVSEASAPEDATAVPPPSTSETP